MAEIIRFSRALWQDERGEVAIYSMVFTVMAAVMIGIVMFASGLDSSFQSVGDLIGSVRAGL
jgi:hypothetical protein